jgi:hypothetical protein
MESQSSPLFRNSDNICELPMARRTHIYRYTYITDSWFSYAHCLDGKAPLIRNYINIKLLQDWRRHMKASLRSFSYCAISSVSNVPQFFVLRGRPSSVKGSVVFPGIDPTRYIEGIIGSGTLVMAEYSAPNLTFALSHKPVPFCLTTSSFIFVCYICVYLSNDSLCPYTNFSYDGTSGGLF